ncbi:MAG: PilN domain-containing protein [Candidatus Saccharibacteria bacterium]
MINLLPDDAKVEILAARTNVILVKYIIVLSLGLIFLCSISLVVYFVLLNTKAGAQATIDFNTSKSASYSSVKTAANDLTSSLATAKTILDKEVDYTKILTNIAQVMPAGVVLDSLSLSPTTFGTPITLQAFAKSTEAALALKTNFQQSPQFSNVTIVSMSDTTQGQTSDYPKTVSLSLTINRSPSL